MAIIGALPNTITNGQSIDATPVMANYNWIVNQVNSNAAALGAINAFTAVQTGVAGNTAGSFPIISQIQNNSTTWCGSSGGTANALTLTPSPAIAAYVAGQEFTFLASATNTGAATIAISGLSTLTLQESASGLLGGEITSGRFYKVLIDASGTTAQICDFSVTLLYKIATSVTTTSSSLALTPTNLGQQIVLQGSTPAQTLTLPTVTGVLGGRGVYVVNTASVAWTLATAGAETITYTTLGTGSATATSITLGPGDSAFYIWRSSSTTWFEQCSVRAANISALAATSMMNYRNYTASATGVNNYNCTITADEVILENSSNTFITQRTVSKVINANGTVGNPLSIMQTRAGSTWYYIWMWYNIANGLTATLDNSATSPTAPTGYVSSDYKARMPGAMRTDGSGNTYLLQIKTTGRDSRYIPLSGSNLTANPSITTSALGTAPTTWSSQAVGAFVPTTATKIGIYAISGSGSGSFFCAPNNSTYTTNTAATIPPISFMATTTSYWPQVQGEMVLESTNIYLITTTTIQVSCFGWSENL
jgi:hypothetical protein